MDKENSAPRVLAATHASKLSSFSRVGGTARAARPALGRDTGPALLRLGRPEHVPCLRFDDARVGASQTLPLRVQNDTPHVQEARFERVPRDAGFLVDPDRVALQPGASHVVRVSWCPSTASRHAHDMRDMRVTLDDGEGDAGRRRRGKKMSLSVKIRGSAVAPANAKSAKSALDDKARPGALSYTFHARARNKHVGFRSRLDSNSVAAVTDKTNDRKKKPTPRAPRERSDGGSTCGRARGQDAQAATRAGEGAVFARTQRCAAQLRVVPCRRVRGARARARGRRVDRLGHRAAPKISRLSP